MKWDAVPGAAQYQVNVTPFTPVGSATGAPARACSGSPRPPRRPGRRWAQGIRREANDTSANVASDSPSLALNGYYCVRVRAERNTDTGNHTVSGNYTYLGNGNDQASFQFTG